jgi:hypothetical protein
MGCHLAACDGAKGTLCPLDWPRLSWLDLVITAAQWAIYQLCPCLSLCIPHTHTQATRAGFVNDKPSETFYVKSTALALTEVCLYVVIAVLLSCWYDCS